MYRAMLAEDEPEVLDAILETIRWEEHGFEKPLGCRDGRQAIEEIEGGFRPDVLITDICMPFVDGLGVTQYINESLPDTIVIILTGYEEFGYAQKAIKLQVYDYILKPVTPDQINALLDRLREELDTRRLRDIEESAEIVADHFLNQLLTKQMSPDSIEERCKLHKFTFPGERHMVAVLDLDLPTPADVEATSYLELMRYGVHNIASELVGSREGVLVAHGRDGITKLIVSAADADRCYALCGELARLVANTIHRYLSLSVSAGIGGPVRTLDNLRRSHSQAMTALGYRFFYGEGSIIREVDIGVRTGKEVDYASRERRILDALKALDEAGVREALEDLFHQLAANHIAFARCSLYCQKLILAVLGLTADIVGIQEVEALEKSWSQLDIYSVATLSRLQELATEICDKAFALLEMVRSDSASAQVQKAQQYIKEHYSDQKLSLNTITEHLAISTSYFSAIFKSHTGSTFVEYLTKVRMEKAKQILAFTDRRTYETAEDVGFSDPHYFSVAFKRVTGMTPKKYREHCKREGVLRE